MVKRILSIMRNVLEDSSIDENSNQQNCRNWDSLHQLQLVSELEDEFDIEFEPEEIAEMIDFDTIKTLITTKCS